MSKHSGLSELEFTANPIKIAGTADPSAGGGRAAPEGSTYMRYVAGAGELWVKVGAANTAWQKISTSGNQAIGGLYTDAGGTAQSGVTGTPTKLTGFANAYGLAILTVPSPAADTIQILQSGLYVVDFHISFSGTANATWTIGMYNSTGPTLVPGCSLQRKLGAGGDVGDAGFHGLIVAATAPQTYQIMVSTDASPSGSLTPVYLGWVLHQVA
jgi:hypothetical protein